MLNCKRKAIFFLIWIVSRKRLNLKPKCPRCVDNAPELYLLKNYDCILTSGCCINTSSKMVNLVMLEWFIENVCWIAVIWEGVIINSRKQWCSSIIRFVWASKFTLPGRNDPLNFPLTLPCSYEWFCSIRGRINLGHIPYLFINFADFLFGQWLCIGKTAFSVTDDWFGIFCGKIQIHWLLINQIKHKIWKPLKILSLSLAFQNLIVPAAIAYIHSGPQ